MHEKLATNGDLDISHILQPLGCNPGPLVCDDILCTATGLSTVCNTGRVGCFASGGGGVGSVGRVYHSGLALVSHHKLTRSFHLLVSLVVDMVRYRVRNVAAEEQIYFLLVNKAIDGEIARP